MKRKKLYCIPDKITTEKCGTIDITVLLENDSRVLKHTNSKTHIGGYVAEKEVAYEYMKLLRKEENEIKDHLRRIK